MPRYIDADNLYERAYKLNLDYIVSDVALRTLKRLLMEEPTAEIANVAEVVRCKDCEYGEQDEDGRWYCRSFGCQVGDADGNGFCADGERRRK